jgi:hypothetical protein
VLAPLQALADELQVAALLLRQAKEKHSMSALDRVPEQLLYDCSLKAQQMSRRSWQC